MDKLTSRTLYGVYHLMDNGEASCVENFQRSPFFSICRFDYAWCLALEEPSRTERQGHCLATCRHFCSNGNILGFLAICRRLCLIGFTKVVF